MSMYELGQEDFALEDHVLKIFVSSTSGLYISSQYGRTLLDTLPLK